MQPEVVGFWRDKVIRIELDLVGTDPLGKLLEGIWSRSDGRAR